MVETVSLKDYYYFLGVKESATSDEIKKAYRRLSVKYHPDKNPNDTFFEERFREVQEAYDTLIDPHRRKIYNQNLNNQIRLTRSSMPPKIQNFSASKIRAVKGEEIKIFWQTYDADLVKIIPFGLEKQQGERAFRINEFDKKGEFVILLHATNSYLNKTAVQGITIREISEAEHRDERTSEPIEQETAAAEAVRASTRIKWLIAVFFLLLLLWLLFS